MKDVSLIVPVRDEGRTIQNLIDSISLQSVLPKEAIFVDGGSKDNTKKLIKEMAGKAPFAIKLLEVDDAFPGEARNLGVKNSSFDLIAFTDAGIELDKRWLEELLRPVEEDERVDCVYGAYEPIIDSFIKECSLIAYIPPKEEVEGKIFRTNFIASSLFKKKVFERLGGFPVHLRAAEDKVFMDKVKGSGAKIYYTDKAKVYWEIPASITGIFNRFSEFSSHDILAGRARDWHWSIFRTYAILLVLVFLGIFTERLFLSGIAVIFLLRLARVFYKKREDFKLKFISDLRYLLTISYIVLVTDVALFCGAARFLRSRYAKRA